MSRQRRVTVGLLAGFVVLTLLALGSLNAFNLHFLTPSGTGQIFLFTALSALIFLLLVVLLVLLCRNILKLYADQRSRVLGSRIRTRLLAGALILSFAPALFMFLFSYLLMNRSIDRWFSQPVAQLREDSVRVALELSQYAAQNARNEAAALAASGSLNRNLEARNSSAVLAELRRQSLTLGGGFAIIYRDGEATAQFQVPPTPKLVGLKPWMDERAEERLSNTESLPTFVLAVSRRADQPVIGIDSSDYILGAATTASGRIIVVGLPMPAGLSSTVANIHAGARDYWTLFRARNRIRGTFFLLMLLLTVLTFFASSWLALYLAKQVTRPVEALADAMDGIAAGHYSRRVAVAPTEEMGKLAGSFNSMAADLEESRALAESSTAQLSEANGTLEQRRRELETILETIPSGVVTLDAELRILRANQAFLDLVQLAPDSLNHDSLTHAEPALATLPLELLFPAEITEELRRLARRSQRMGIAAGELEFHARRGLLRFSATLALLQISPEQRGYILVLEDVTESLRAQRQVAWKEVAQRIAHEIKNPLTPISLSAERIRKHTDRPTQDSPAVIRKCSDVILGSVETMRTLVDQFAVLAEFPSSSPRPVELGTVIAAAMLPFSGRLEDIHVEQRLAPNLPLVLADPEAMKRALANLIDNAAEAMQSSLLRRLTILTGLNESRTMAEIVVADTGYGITSEMRERLFLPYFSTKQRGTGLGLAIAAKIVQEHQGTIRAEQNTPAGARFIIELPLAEVSTDSDSPTSGPAPEHAEAKLLL